ncbi:hypothetical protein JCM8097_006480 [Rhodosporidiobolus ruineniae]
MNPLSGSNRLPVSPRRTTHPLPLQNPLFPAIGTPRRPPTSTYTRPFPVPSYLRHASLYADRFYTTPSERSDYSALESAPTSETAGEEALASRGGSTSALKKKPSLSDALLVGSQTAGGGTAAGDAPILLPTCWDEDDRCALLELSSDGLSVSFAGSAKYGDRDAAAIRANRPVPSQAGIYYYEVQILDKGTNGYIGIGLSHRTVSLSRLPGWEENSYGFHADDGRAFCCQGTGERFGPTFTTGDVVGCGVDWTNAGPPRADNERSGPGGKEAQRLKEGNTGGRVFFTKNGTFLGYAFYNLQGKLYPTVGLRTPHEAVRVNFGHEPFRFDIEGLVLERKRTILSRIASSGPSPSSLLSTPPSPPIPALLPPSVTERTHEALQALISSYLVHNGYAASASAFSKQIRSEREERAKGLLPASPSLPSASTSAAAPPAQEDDLLSSIASSSALRAQIRTAATSGHAQLALSLLETHYPAVLTEQGEEDGGVLFKLRCRVFIEAVLALSKANKEGISTDASSEGKDTAMDDAASAVNPDPAGETFTTPPTSPTSSSAPPSPPTLDALLSLGRELHAAYSAEPRPRVRDELQAVLGLMAYQDPEADASGRTRECLRRSEREKVADEVNRAVLLASHLPPIPALEHLYRHTVASVQLAGDLGSGAAALVDVQKELRV